MVYHENLKALPGPCLRFYSIRAVKTRCSSTRFRDTNQPCRFNLKPSCGQPWKAKAGPSSLCPKQRVKSFLNADESPFKAPSTASLSKPQPSPMAKAATSSWLTEPCAQEPKLLSATPQASSSSRQATS